MVNTPGSKIKSDQNAWGTVRSKLRDNFKNPCTTPSYNHFKAGDEMEIIVDENLVLKEKKGCKYYIKTYLAIN